jgi:hypothetical protein
MYANLTHQAVCVALRGRDCLLQHIQHTADNYSFFVSLTQAARREIRQELCWWETGAVCERRYQVHEQWYNLGLDARQNIGWDNSGCVSGWSRIAGP